MGSGQSSGAPTADSIFEYVKKNAPKAKKSAMTMHGDPTSVREADHKGHHIVVKTTYHIEVDGEPVTGHLIVTNDGQVQYHPIPNMSFDSAIDLVKKLIDVFPDEFPAGGKPAQPDMPGHGMSGPMSAMRSMPSKAKRSKPDSAKPKRPKPRKAKAK